MKTYEIWIEVKEYDDGIGHRNLEFEGCVEPRLIGTFNTLKEANEAVEALTAIAKLKSPKVSLGN